MNIYRAMKRLDKIDWDSVGERGDRTDGELFAEFLRRLAVFFLKAENPDITNPMMQIGRLYCWDDTIPARYEVFAKLPQNVLFIKIVVWGYIQCALDVDSGTAPLDVQEVFEPLLLILQRGGMFYRGEHSTSAVEVRNAAYFPLTKNWYEHALRRPPFGENSPHLV